MVVVVGTQLEAVGVLCLEELRAKEGVEHFVIHILGLSLFLLGVLSVLSARVGAALLINGMVAVEELAGEQELLFLVVAGEVLVQGAVRNEPVELSCAYLDILRNSAILLLFKLRVFTARA